MTKYILAFFMLTFSMRAYSQDAELKKYKEECRAIFKSSGTHTVVKQSYPYPKSSDAYRKTSPFQEFLNSRPDYLFGNGKVRLYGADSVVLDSNSFPDYERKEIIDYFNKCKSINWTNDFLGDSVRFINASAIDSSNNLSGYSVPLFIRNYTVCIFFEDREEDCEDMQTIWLYCKRQGAWRFFAVLSNSTSYSTKRLVIQPDK